MRVKEECERGERGVEEENKNYAYFPCLKKAPLDAPILLSVGGVRGEGLGEENWPIISSQERKITVLGK